MKYLKTVLLMIGFLLTSYALSAGTLSDPLQIEIERILEIHSDADQGGPKAIFSEQDQDYVYQACNELEIGFYGWVPWEHWHLLDEIAHDISN